MIFSKLILFAAFLGVVSASSIERSNLRGNDRALIPMSPSNEDLTIDNELTTSVSNNCNDDTTFLFWGLVDKDCEMVRATVTNQTYHDENGDFLRTNCLDAQGNKESYCPSCAMTEVFEKCPTVCEPLRCTPVPTASPTTSPSSPPTPFCYDDEDPEWCEWAAEDLARCDFAGGNQKRKVSDSCRVTCVPECRHSESEEDDPTFNYMNIDGQGCRWIREQFINPAYLDEVGMYSSSKCLDENLNMGMRVCPSCELFPISNYCPSVCA